MIEGGTSGIEVIGPQKYYLVKYDFNWADEADFEGFEVVDQAGMDDINEGIDGAEYPMSHYFGSNEEVEWEDAAEVKSGITVIEITHSEYESIVKLFSPSFGSTPCFADWKYDRED